MRTLLLGAMALLLVISCDLPMVADLNQAIADNPNDINSPNYEAGPQVKFGVVYFSSGNNIYWAKVDPNTGGLSGFGGVNTGSTIASIKIDPKGKYAVLGYGDGSTTGAYKIDQTSGALVSLSGGPAFGAGTASSNTRFDPSGTYFYTFSYVSSNMQVSTFKMNGDSPFAWVNHTANPSTSDGYWTGAFFSLSGKSFYTVGDSAGAFARAFAIDAVGQPNENNNVGWDSDGTAAPPTAAFLDVKGRFLFAFGSQGVFNSFPLTDSTIGAPKKGRLQDHGAPGNPDFSFAAPTVDPTYMWSRDGKFFYFTNNDLTRDLNVYRIEDSNLGNLVYSGFVNSIGVFQSATFDPASKHVFTTRDSGASVPPYYVERYDVSATGTWTNKVSVEVPDSAALLGGETYSNQNPAVASPSGQFAAYVYNLTGANAGMRLGVYHFATDTRVTPLNLSQTTPVVAIPGGPVKMAIGEVFK